MRRTLSFRFADPRLNERLVALLKEHSVAHHLDKNGQIHYAPEDADLVENELVSSVRARVFPSWQVLTCPGSWRKRYEQYMRRHDIPFEIEYSDGEVWYLLPQKYRPHRWKLGDPVAAVKA